MENYSLVKQIGKGSYGKVWLIKKNNNNKQYVLKQIDMQNSSKQEQCAAYTEVKLLSTLKHPNIVSYHNSFQKSNGALNIIMGYCENGDLYTYIRSRKGLLFPEKQVVEWFIQICMALQYLHEGNILHRDLKTENIFLTKTKIIKIGDFGIARILNSTCDLATTLIGTPYYMSPELFANQPYNHKSDVWALGCCVYEMATLKHAFNSKDLNSLMYSILLGKLPSMPKEYSEELVNLIRLMLSYDAGSRPSVKCILQNDYVRRHIMDFLQDTSNWCKKSSDQQEKHCPSWQSFPLHRNNEIANAEKHLHSKLNRVSDDLEVPHMKETPKDIIKITNVHSSRTKNITAPENLQEQKSGNCFKSKVVLPVQNINKHNEVPEDFSKDFVIRHSNLPGSNEVAMNVCPNNGPSVPPRINSSYHTEEKNFDKERINTPPRRRRQEAVRKEVFNKQNKSNTNQKTTNPRSLAPTPSHLTFHSPADANVFHNEEHHSNIHMPNSQQNRCISAITSVVDSHIIHKNSEARRRRREKLQKQQWSAKQTVPLPQKIPENSATQVITDRHYCAEAQLENMEEKIDAEVQEFIGMLNSTLQMNDKDNEEQHLASGKADEGCENKMPPTTETAAWHFVISY